MRKKHIIIPSCLLLFGLLLFLLKPADAGAPHTPYFAAMNTELKKNAPGRPILVLDLDRLDQNLAVLNKQIQPPRNFRLVAKSLPSLELIQYVFEKTGTRRTMVFHQPHLNLLAIKIPRVEILLGKPMPAQAAASFYQNLPANAAFNPETQLEWLIDSPRRLEQYLQLARKLNRKMLINIEIDVGLHRGGLRKPEELAPIFKIIAANQELLTFRGFMGYDPHVTSAPPVLSSRKSALQNVIETYRSFIAYAKKEYPALYPKKPTLNGAGSKTYQLYTNKDPMNDLSLGSALVKPADFDSDTLANHKPALFIATPIIKRSRGVRIPFIEFTSSIFSAWNPNQQISLFIYGGNWKARYHSPAGITRNKIYGDSSNQEMANGSEKIGVNIDDYVFLRPTQSEAVMLQFGGLYVMRGGKLVGEWSTF